MSVHAPFFREAGAGRGVVCLRSNASSSSQWRLLLERLAPHARPMGPITHPRRVNGAIEAFLR